MGAERTKGPWAAVRNDGAYVKDPKFATWRIEERSTPAEMVVALVVSDVKALNAEANAAFIVRAANSHEELVEALKQCVDRFERIDRFLEKNGPLPNFGGCAFDAAHDLARAALSKATAP